MKTRKCSLDGRWLVDAVMRKKQPPRMWPVGRCWRGLHCILYPAEAAARRRRSFRLQHMHACVRSLLPSARVCWLVLACCRAVSWPSRGRRDEALSSPPDCFVQTASGPSLHLGRACLQRLVQCTGYVGLQFPCGRFIHSGPSAQPFAPSSVTKGHARGRSKPGRRPPRIFYSCAFLWSSSSLRLVCSTTAASSASFTFSSTSSISCRRCHC